MHMDDASRKHQQQEEAVRRVVGIAALRKLRLHGGRRPRTDRRQCRRVPAGC